MIDTEDLSSYIPGYDDYCEPKNYEEEYDNSDELHDEFMIRKEQQKMERKVIDLSISNMTLDEIMQLENYVWKQDKLIPVEMIEGE